ncbi:hypothetical protein ALC62_12699 [Cyphomyrmex costatus]|uniref:Uncharacterized protein n=1 Tax=Cyphomyrmex costatus TaxID=456900 RepID=A0A195C735_9HYME|nr:hypothetical protein ALC62_12699 [Cyphomyrmex costatus]
MHHAAHGNDDTLSEQSRNRYIGGLPRRAAPRRGRYVSHALVGEAAVLAAAVAVEASRATKFPGHESRGGLRIIVYFSLAIVSGHCGTSRHTGTLFLKGCSAEKKFFKFFSGKKDEGKRYTLKGIENFFVFFTKLRNMLRLIPELNGIDTSCEYRIDSRCNTSFLEASQSTIILINIFGLTATFAFPVYLEINLRRRRMLFDLVDGSLSLVLPKTSRYKPLIISPLDLQGETSEAVVIDQSKPAGMALRGP